MRISLTFLPSTLASGRYRTHQTYSQVEEAALAFVSFEVSVSSAVSVSSEVFPLFVVRFEVVYFELMEPRLVPIGGAS